MKKITLEFPKDLLETKVIVEAAHIYTNKYISIEELKGANIGGFISNYLEQFGAQIEKWLLIDNYNPSFKNSKTEFDIKGYLAKILQQNFVPDKIIYESSLINSAEEALKYISSKNMVIEEGGVKYLHKNKIALFDEKLKKFSCALLDACLYNLKLENSEYCITILEEKYVTQQKKTINILKKLGTDTNKIIPIFYNKNNNIKNVALGDIIQLIPWMSVIQGTMHLSDKTKLEAFPYGL